MPLQLSKPLAFIDLETTGISLTRDRIVEIAITKVLITGEVKRMRKLINPEMQIPDEVIAIHGISNEMVKDAPTFKAAAHDIKQFISNADLGGYNSNKFDIPLLVEEFLRADVPFDIDAAQLIDVMKVFHILEPRNLSAAYKFYCNKILENAHSAQADVDATWEILQAQIEKYPQLGNTIESIKKITGTDDLIDFARRFVKQNGVAVFNFGKHKGKPVIQVLTQEPQYYNWIMNNDFERNTKQKLEEIYTNMKLNLKK